MNLTGSDRIFQIHPTRRCNLRCLHCYSDSSPDATDELPAELATRLVADAAALGYTVASVSGGEPFLYGALPEVLGAAKTAGMRTQVVSNGLALTAARLDAVQPVLDLLAVSIDGPPADHDRMRGLSGSFRRLDQRLSLVRERGIPFGLLFTLTMWNVHELEWAVDYAMACGARLLQVHPLEASGRAVALADDVPDETEAAMALLEGLRLQARFGQQLAIHIDVALASQLLDVIGGRRDDRPSHISDVISPLVVEPDGICVPLEYGFPRHYALGDTRDHSLAQLAERWLDDVWPSFRTGLGRMRDDLRSRDSQVVVNPYATLRNTTG